MTFQSTSKRARKIRHTVVRETPQSPPVVDTTLVDRPVLLEAWLNQKSEWTKSLFTISSAAVALIVTALLANENKLLPPTLTFLVLSGIGFGASTMACVAAFTKSADAVDELLNVSAASRRRKHEEHPEKALERLASIQRGGFEFGISLLGVAAFVQVVVK